MTPAKLAAWHLNEAMEWDELSGATFGRKMRAINLSAALSIIRWQGRPKQRAEAIRLLEKLEGRAR